MSADATWAFVDTNVLVYAHDTMAGPKREAAHRLVDDLWRTRKGCLSIQVLQEFFVTVTGHIADPLDSSDAAAAVADYAKWSTHAPSAGDVLSAIETRERFGISFWDAMIVHSAAALGCDVLYSEDLSHGQRYDGVLLVDPFAP